MSPILIAVCLLGTPAEADENRIDFLWDRTSMAPPPVRLRRQCVPPGLESTPVIAENTRGGGTDRSAGCSDTHLPRQREVE